MDKHLSFSHPSLLDHGSLTHPENANRLQAIFDGFKNSLFGSLLTLSCDRKATFEELASVHDPAYVNFILSLSGQESSVDPETLISPGSVNAALIAAGIGLELVERVIDGKLQNGFALVRPPGHHARPAQGMGFCIFNNIAIAAKKALAKGIKRILILDWDVHHGNGTQEAFYETDQVLFIDIHQDNLFPVPSGSLDEKGKGKGAGFTINVPLTSSCRDEDYLYIFDSLVRPLALKYQPELILVSAGFDAHESDPMGFMNLTTKGYGRLTEKVKKLAEEVCKGKLVFFLEGGYNPYYLAQNVLECVKVLAEDVPLSPDTTKESAHSKAVETFIKTHYGSFI